MSSIALKNLIFLMVFACEWLSMRWSIEKTFIYKAILHRKHWKTISKTRYLLSRFWRTGGGGMGLHMQNDGVDSTFVYDCHAVGRGRLQ